MADYEDEHYSIGFLFAGEHLADVEDEAVYGVAGDYDCGGHDYQKATENVLLRDGLTQYHDTENDG